MDGREGAQPLDQARPSHGNVDAARRADGDPLREGERPHQPSDPELQAEGRDRGIQDATPPDPWRSLGYLPRVAAGPEEALFGVNLSKTESGESPGADPLVGRLRGLYPRRVGPTANAGERG
jgi:hypothetical protein